MGNLSAWFVVCFLFLLSLPLSIPLLFFSLPHPSLPSFLSFPSSFSFSPHTLPYFLFSFSAALCSSSSSTLTSVPSPSPALWCHMDISKLQLHVSHLPALLRVHFTACPETGLHIPGCSPSFPSPQTVHLLVCRPGCFSHFIIPQVWPLSCSLGATP